MSKQTWNSASSINKSCKPKISGGHSTQIFALKTLQLSHIKTKQKTNETIEKVCRVVSDIRRRRTHLQLLPLRCPHIGTSISFIDFAYRPPPPLYPHNRDRYPYLSTIVSRWYVLARRQFSPLRGPNKNRATERMRKYIDIGTVPSANEHTQSVMFESMIIRSADAGQSNLTCILSRLNIYTKCLLFLFFFLAKIAEFIVRTFSLYFLAFSIVFRPINYAWATCCDWKP